MYRVSLQFQDLAKNENRVTTSYLLAVEALKRDYEVYNHNKLDLTMGPDGLTLRARRLILGDGDTLVCGKPEKFHYSDFDILMIRNPLPIDMADITSYHLLETIDRTKTLIANDPRAVRVLTDKMMSLKLTDHMPPTLITGNLEQIRGFRTKHEDIVIKPLFHNGGQGLLRITPSSTNLSSLIEMYQNGISRPWMIQKYIPEVRISGHKKALVTQDQIIGTITRVATESTMRANTTAGIEPVPCTLNEQEQSMVADTQAFMKEYGILYAGVNMIGGYLTEINTIKPVTKGMPGAEKAIWDAVIAAHTKQCGAPEDDVDDTAEGNIEDGVTTPKIQPIPADKLSASNAA